MAKDENSMEKSPRMDEQRPKWTNGNVTFNAPELYHGLGEALNSRVSSSWARVLGGGTKECNVSESLRSVAMMRIVGQKMLLAAADAPGQCKPGTETAIIGEGRATAVAAHGRCTWLPAAAAAPDGGARQSRLNGTKATWAANSGR